MTAGLQQSLFYNVPAARNCAPALCRFCGMLISNALRSATAWWNCSSAILKAVNAPSSIAPCSKQFKVSRRISSASACIRSSSSAESLRGAGATHDGQHHQSPPDVIAVAIEEALFLAVDKGRGAWMHWNRGVLVGIRGLDLRSQRVLAHQLLPN